MDDQRLGVADVGQVAKQLDAVDQFGARLLASFDPKPTIAPVPSGKYLFAFA